MAGVLRGRATLAARLLCVFTQPGLTADAVNSLCERKRLTAIVGDLGVAIGDAPGSARARYRSSQLAGI